jgi:hypothetical protein
VIVQNNSGSDCPQYGVLGVDTSVPITPTASVPEFQLRRLIQGVTPTSAHKGKFVICLDAIPDGQIGRAVAAGVMPVQIDASGMTTGVMPQFADVEATQTYLQPASGGAQIFWCDDASNADGGLVWAYVRIPAITGSTRCKAMTVGAVAKTDTTFTVDNVLPLDGPSPVTSSGDTLTVDNWPYFEANDNTHVRIEWDQNLNSGAGGWSLYMGPCMADGLGRD